MAIQTFQAIMGLQPAFLVLVLFIAFLEVSQADDSTTTTTTSSTSTASTIEELPPTTTLTSITAKVTTQSGDSRKDEDEDELFANNTFVIIFSVLLCISALVVGFALFIYFSRRREEGRYGDEIALFDAPSASLLETMKQTQDLREEYHARNTKKQPGSSNNQKHIDKNTKRKYPSEISVFTDSEPYGFPEEDSLPPIPGNSNTATTFISEPPPEITVIGGVSASTYHSQYGFGSAEEPEETFDSFENVDLDGNDDDNDDDSEVFGFAAVDQLMEPGDRSTKWDP